jgi:hypothetical protein
MLAISFLICKIKRKTILLKVKWFKVTQPVNGRVWITAQYSDSSILYILCLSYAIIHIYKVYIAWINNLKNNN